MNLRMMLVGAALLTAVAAGSTLRAGDILLNGDFLDGKTHWHGDGTVSDTGGRMVITLKPDKWTVVYQEFSAESAQLRLKITYSYSSDCSLAQKRSDDQLVPPLTAQGLEQATGMENAIGSVNLSGTASWLVLVTSGGRSRGIHSVYETTSPSDPRTYSATLSEWSMEFNREDLCLAFPPGTGDVTIHSVKLIPPGDPAP